MLGGNKQVARAVATGALAFGLTDTDDALIELEAGYPVEIVYPDQGVEATGNAIHSQHSCPGRGCTPSGVCPKRLIEYLLSPEVEADTWLRVRAHRSH